MAIKTFTSGEVLTASDTNTYLANAGLVYVTSTTIGSAVSSVTVSNCFSSTYDNYRIQVTGGTASGNFVMKLQVGASTTGYYFAGAYCTYAGTILASAGANQAAFNCTAYNTNCVSADIFLGQPNLAKNTSFHSIYFGPSTGDGAISWQGYLNDTTAHTGFTISTSSGTLTGGTITVYGYRKA